MQSVIVSFDSLAANCIGCYGNEWVETPNWDRLAASGAVFDRHFLNSRGQMASSTWCSGLHPGSDGNANRPINLGSLLRSNSIATQLIVSGELQLWQREVQFDEVEIVTGHDGADAKPDETPFAMAVKAGISAWNASESQSKSRLLWVHTAGPGIPPKGFDDLYFEDFEERGQQISELSDEARSQHPAVYAGAVSLLDHWFGELLTGIQASFAEQPTLVIVMAAQGSLWQSIRPSVLNESQELAMILGDQVAKTPLILKSYGDSRFKDLVSLRSRRLTQASDFVPTLIDWFGLNEPARACSEEEIRRNTKPPHPASPREAGARSKTSTITHSDLDPDPIETESRGWLRELTEEIPARQVLFYSDGENTIGVRTNDWLCLRELASASPQPLSTEAAAEELIAFATRQQLPDPQPVVRPGQADPSPQSLSPQSRGEEQEWTSRLCLYLKPEDIWDVNNIASQQPEVVDELTSQFLSWKLEQNKARPDDRLDR